MHKTKAGKIQHSYDMFTNGSCRNKMAANKRKNVIEFLMGENIL